MFGPIHAVEWPRGAAVDADTRGALSYDQPLVNDDKPCDTYQKSLRSTRDRINTAGITYNPLTSNSNSVVNQMLIDAGLGRLRRNVRAPAAGTVLLP